MTHFRILARDGAARAGVLRTAHGPVETPAFMPVGTQATVKTLAPEEVEGLGAQMILANTYHLMLRPGADLVATFGGLHNFMGWQHPILTDSGGFQVFSLNHLTRVTAAGAEFRSHLDGSLHQLTPERCIAVQEQLGADVIMALDHPPAYPSDAAHWEEATARTHDWAARCVRARTRGDQLLFGIGQGGFDPAARRASAAHLAPLGFDGLAVGGLSLGEPKPLTYSLLEASLSGMPDGAPRYLMGVGTPQDLLEGVARGVDLFDCVLPTRIARTGTILTRRGRVNLRNAALRADPGPLEAGCACPACARFSRAYVRHLFLAGEILGHRLATLHNLHVLLQLMREVRGAIQAGRFELLKHESLAAGAPVAYS
jgi:queuine tRNA-ribosyltransferase